MKRRDLIVALAAAVLAVAALGAAAEAAAGEALTLGRFNTAGRNKTTLWANANGAALRVKNARPGQEALRLENDGSAPPVWVNSPGWVDRLNVDEVDGYDAADLTRVAWCLADNATDGTDFSCEATIDAPEAGFVVFSGSAELWRAVAGDDTVTCRFLIGGSEAVGSVRDVALNGDAYPDPSSEANCATDSAATVPAGSHTFTFEVASVGTGTGIVDVGAWVLYTPFRGDGTTAP